MDPQTYRVVNEQANEISGWNILSRIMHARAPNIVGTNGDVQSDFTTL